ncbi:neutral alpha-glucosidase C-like isoform X2 [Symsagittifera roscoffensis]|uniref:neutral alpha-glucosidase C-like isoform X2 n=1 Tax=Symsagittifera roscoffensis TaxID=84072 RepID=UPI00307B1D60
MAAVKRHDFKTCKDSSFCQRHRQLPKNSLSFYVSKSVQVSKESVQLEISGIENKKPLLLSITLLNGPMFRFKVNEVDPLYPRFEVPFVIEQLPQQQTFSIEEDSKERLVLSASSADVKCVVMKNPLVIFVLHQGEVIVQLNKDWLLKFEEYRAKPLVTGGTDNEKQENEDDEDNEDVDAHEADEEEAHEDNQGEQVKDTQEDESEDTGPDEKKAKLDLEKGMWDESFKSHPDSKPRGPASVGMDIGFPGFKHIYGIPEHADSFNLRNTMDGDPYRMYNLDVFEYELDSRMALYGAIPAVVAHNAKRSVGILWLNAAETWIDVDRPEDSKPILKKLSDFVSKSSKENSDLVTTHWISESGIIDLFVFVGPTAKNVFSQYASLTGLAPLPPAFSIAYHQCRWNYNDDKDCRAVDSGFDEHDIPYDVLWLDIEHTVEKKYFTWDAHKFPDSKQLLDDLNAKGRKMVTIIDPHIKRTGGFHVYDEATRLGYFVKKSDGKTDYNGWCWPGDSSWVDYLNPAAQTWWAGLFSLDMYKGSTLSLFTWNDMNEPSVFNGPEITMHKDALHHGGVEHRDIHNMYGMLMVMATNRGQLLRSHNQHRPFVLSRSFFAGGQRLGAVWTGDNKASWEHMRASIPMLLSMNVVGLTFVGADVGGFFGDPSPELLVRWYQLAAFTPFFRAHAHIETKRREPWLFGEENTKRIRNAIRRRYTFLPYWYTQFFKTSVTGQPLMRPYWVEFPTAEEFFDKEDAFMVGPSLLVAPVLHEGSTSVNVALPGTDLWYDYKTLTSHQAPLRITVEADMDSIPVYYRGGSILPTRGRIRRSSVLSRDDPLTLIVAPDSKGFAEGDLYLDDEHTFQYRMGKFLYRYFSYSASEATLKCAMAKRIVAEPGFTTQVPVHGSQKFVTKVKVERVIVLNVSKQPKEAILTSGGESKTLVVLYDPASKSATVRKPDVNIADDFSIQLVY